MAFALSDVSKGPNSPVVGPSLVNHWRGVSIQNSSIPKLNFIAADLVFVLVEISHFLQELLWILGRAHDVLERSFVIFALDDLRWKLKQLRKSPVAEYDPVVAVYDQDSIDRRVGLRFEKGRLGT